eukprot:TRINITY_DN96543_c0_g1_i1.p1 TRINITY_DN96543_c0_g1~~TRINITY_DN96543_c0_g1_i1.p1  ORF type:complete len:259 (+),score=6.86 TRINITY_DN96543_c0_g1_i1:89-778(+)
MGEYRVAHKTLFDTFQTLQRHNVKVPSDLKRNLMLLHSYIVVRVLIKQLKDDETAAWILVRIAKNITKFPRDLVPILTSTVIKCQRVGLKGSMYEYAAMLIRPEHRNLIATKYKKKVQNVVRLNGKLGMVDPTEPSSPCPFCNTLCPNTTLDCDNCKNTIPFCIVTGKHMVNNDWSCCPCCKFPALHSALEALTEQAGHAMCPMCAATIEAKMLARSAPKSQSAEGGQQ